MVYITVRQPPMFHQMTLEELLFQDYRSEERRVGKECS